MKTAPSMALVAALAISMTACDSKPAQRDVYTSIGDCLADWKDYNLCAQMSDEDAKRQGQTSGGGNGGSFFFWGPSYYGDRSVSHNGSYYTPTQTRARSTATYTQGLKSSPTITSPRPGNPSAMPVSRGGFGATGRSVGISS